MKKCNAKLTNILISGYYGFDNFGDEAILGILIDKLKKIGGINISVLSNNPSKTSDLYGVRSVFSFDLFRIFEEICKCDILIMGGGSLLQDATSLKSLLYYLFIMIAALCSNKKVITFAQGIGPINSKLGLFLTKLVLKHSALVTVRDEKSLFLLRGWGGINTYLVCDPLFDLKLAHSFPSNKVGVQLRDFKTLKEDLLINLAQQINKDFSDKEIEIYSFQDSLDLPVCKRFETMLKSFNPLIRTKLIYGQNPQEILEKVSKLDYMIAMRFHANLISLKYGIKTLAICYDEKVEKLAEEAQIPCLSMAVNEDYDNLFTRLKDLNKQHLIDFSDSKHFDWLKIEEIINL